MAGSTAVATSPGDNLYEYRSSAIRLSMIPRSMLGIALEKLTNMVLQKCWSTGETDWTPSTEIASDSTAHDARSIRTPTTLPTTGTLHATGRNTRPNLDADTTDRQARQDPRSYGGSAGWFAAQ